MCHIHCVPEKVRLYDRAASGSGIACSSGYMGPAALQVSGRVSGDMGPPLSPVAVTGPPDHLFLDPDPACCLLYTGSVTATGSGYTPRAPTILA